MNQIEKTPLNQIQPHPKNARKGNTKLIAESLKENGQYKPIIVDAKTGNILAGNHTYKAACELGWDTINTIKLPNLTAKQATKILLADNRTSDEATYDYDQLTQLIDEIRDDLEGTGWTVDDIPTGMIDQETGQESTIIRPDESNIQEGELYQLGDHRIICGSSTDKTIVQKLLAGATPKLMVTDPPYGIEVDHSWRNDVLNKQRSSREKILNDDRCDWTEAWLLSPAEIAYIWVGSSNFKTFIESIENAGYRLRQEIIWAKDNFSFGRSHYHWQHESCLYAIKEGCNANWKGDRKQTTVWHFSSPISVQAANTEINEATAHPTQKPVELYLAPIKNHTEKGDSIYEPFCGSGTAIIAAEQLGRKCYAIELDPRYVQTAITRWENLTGKKAELIDA